jgi:hypothetical protein
MTSPQPQGHSIPAAQLSSCGVPYPVPAPLSWIEILASVPGAHCLSQTINSALLASEAPVLNSLQMSSIGYHLPDTGRRGLLERGFRWMKDRLSE